MASTIKLSDSISWAQQFVRNRALAFPALTPAILEPALTNANTVKMAMLGPPFSWRFNRASLSITTVAAQQDYPQAAPTFGFIEKAVTKDAAGNINELTNFLNLSQDSRPGVPDKISAQLDDNAGDITFRLMPVPDAVYTCLITQQQKTALFTALAGLWAPIPDEYSYIFNFGFLALTLLYADDARFQWANQKFVAHLLGAQQGLTQTQVNIFLNQWQMLTGTAISLGVNQTQGEQARGV